MAQVVVSMKTIDLRTAELQPVTGQDVKAMRAIKTLQGDDDLKRPLRNLLGLSLLLSSRNGRRPSGKS